MKDLYSFKLAYQGLLVVIVISSRYHEELPSFLQPSKEPSLDYPHFSAIDIY